MDTSYKQYESIALEATAVVLGADIEERVLAWATSAFKSITTATGTSLSAGNQSVATKPTTKNVIEPVGQASEASISGTARSRLVAVAHCI